jgi:hypothetical protein
MDRIVAKVKEWIQKPLYAAIAGFVIGLIIGLPVLGWGLWPVKWKDADASFLRQDLKEQYLCMVVDSYSLNKDANLALSRLESMDSKVKDNLSVLDSLQKGGCNYAASDPVVMELKTALLGTAPAAPVVGEQETEVPKPTQAATTGKQKSTALLLSLLCALFLLIGGALAYIFLIRNKRTREDVPPPLDDDIDYLEEELAEEPEIEEIPELDDTPEVQETPQVPVVPEYPVKSVPPAATFSGEPTAHFITTYVIGDDLYDDSFSIDAPNGAFLGECGVGISDTIGVGDPKKVTAFEVWLFDKNDIQTVTKVLMSAHAMNDGAIKQRLASKGEPILVEPGQQILLETATLQMEARVVELVYGQGAMPSGSFFERMTLELTVFPK